MGLQQFERRLERLVEGVFAKAFRGGLQPVEIGRRLTREMDLRRTIGVRGMIAPNRFIVALSNDDFERFEPFDDALTRELGDAAREHARNEGYAFVGPVQVTLEEDPALYPGMFLVAGSMVAGPATGPDVAVVLPDGRRFTVGEKPLVIGRLPECSIVVHDPNVSRRHAEVRRQEGTIVLADLGSTNGTRVNDIPVTVCKLEDGDQITLGRTTLAIEVT